MLYIEKQNVIYNFAKIGIIIVCIIVPIKIVSAQECRWIQAETQDTNACQRRLGNNKETWVQQNICSAQKNSVFDSMCCCQKTASKRIIIISSVAVFFTLVTAGILIARNYE